MIMSLMCFIFYAFGHKVLGIGFLIVTVLLLINEIKQNNVKIGG
jgi:hypothetical protein